MAPHGRAGDGPAAPTVLGIVDSHDAGVALVRDGQLLFALNEERLVRRKNIGGLPEASLRSMWDHTDCGPDDIDVVALAGTTWLGTPPTNSNMTHDDGHASTSQKLAELIDATPGLSQLQRLDLSAAAFRALMRHGGPARARLKALRSILDDIGVTAPIRTYDHHDCHLAVAHVMAGGGESLILSNDGFGDGLCAKVAVGRAGRLTEISTNPMFNSIGTIYNYATHLCGFPKLHHAGKTTGLAATGDPARTIDAFTALVRWDPASARYINHGPLFSRAIRAIERSLDGAAREDIAAGVQHHLEQTLVDMTRHFVGATGVGRVVLVGGVHANVRVNQAIAELPGVTDLFVCPHMGDGGLAAGAAWLAHADCQGALPELDRRSDVYLGPAYGETDIAPLIREHGLSVEQPADLARAVTARLAEGQVVAVFDGAMEWGPRALGNRSILAAPTDHGVTERLNESLGRSEFMPFAPIVQEELAGTYFNAIDGPARDAARFMTATFTTTDQALEEAPAIVHVDGTARPQVLAHDTNPFCHDILTAYRRQTGRALLINTSFNRHEEPIVCSPDDAVRTFVASGLDALVAGPFLVPKPGSVG